MITPVSRRGRTEGRREGKRNEKVRKEGEEVVDKQTRNILKT